MPERAVLADLPPYALPKRLGQLGSREAFEHNGLFRERMAYGGASETPVLVPACHVLADQKIVHFQAIACRAPRVRVADREQALLVADGQSRRTLLDALRVVAEGLVKRRDLTELARMLAGVASSPRSVPVTATPPFRSRLFRVERSSAETGESRRNGWQWTSECPRVGR